LENYFVVLICRFSFHVVFFRVTSPQSSSVAVKLPVFYLNKL